MKKFLLLLGLGMAALSVTAQQGLTCADPISISAGNCVNNITIDGPDHIWFSFQAQTSVAQISLANPADPEAAHIHRLVLYDGCNGQQITNSYGSAGHKDIDLYGYHLTAGQTYYVRAERGLAAEIIPCRNCTIPGAGATYSVCYTARPDNFTEPLNACGDPCPNNLFVNGDFEQGDTGFFVGPGLTYNQCTQILAPYRYGICADANNLNSPWNRPAHNGVSLFVDDGPTPLNQADVACWGQNVNVVPGNEYCISMYFANINPAPGDVVPDIFVDIDGNNTNIQYVHLGALPYADGWKHFTINWNSGSNTNVTIVVRSFHNGNSMEGNDFGMDDFEMTGLMAPPAITANPAVTGCPGQFVVLSVSQPPGTTVTWQPGNLTSASITVSPSTTTTYTVTIDDGCVPASGVYTVNVTPFFTDFVAVSGCANTPLAFNNISSSVLSTTYSWNFGDGSPPDNSVNPAHIYSAPGTYTVTLTATNSCGTQTAAHAIQIVPSTATYNVNCCSQSQVFTHEGKIFIFNPISNPEVWSGQHYYVRGTIVVWPGAELDIVNGSTIEFDPLSKILVLPGAVLKVDNSTLTGLQVCGTMWQGVEAQGDNTKTQTQQNSNGCLYQAKVILSSATISLAHTGVVLGGLNQQSNGYDPAKGGGILQATSSGFINCGYGVRIIPYPFVNLSRLTGCTFNSTTLPDPGYLAGNSYSYPNPANPLYAYANTLQRTYADVQAFGVRWVQMTGSVLNNAEYGLIGVNSSLRVGGLQPGQGNSFSNMNQAEVHSNFFNSPFYANRTMNNDYSNSLIPIQSWNGIGDQIHNNRITSAFVGIGCVGTGSLFITDNQLGLNGNSCLVGISASNTGTQGGLIGRVNSGNTFTQCYNGTWLPNNNPFLQVHCNNYVNPVASTYVSNWRNFGFLANQGYLPIQTDKDPAGNKFVQYSPLRNQIESPTFIFDYYHHSADAGGNPLTVMPDPIGAITTSNMINTGIQETNTSCIAGPPCTNCHSLIMQMTAQVSSLENEKAAIEAQLNGGQEQVLLNAINSNMNSGQLKNLLLVNSPLSDQVLLAYIGRNGTPPGIFKDVLIQNSPVSKEVRPALYAKIGAMPPGIKNQIIAAQSNYQNRTLSVVDGELQSATGKRQELYNQQMAYYIDRTETDSTANDSIKLQLQAQNTQAALEALASTCLAEENYTAATTVIHSLHPQSPEAQAEKDLLSLLLSLYSGGRDIFQMTAAEELFVRNTAALSGECLARSNARVILFAAFGEPLDLDIQLNGQRTANPEPEIRSNEPVPSFLGESYPNPAGDQVNMECNVPEGLTGNLSIFDINGRLIYNRQISSGLQIVSVDVSQWVDGMYLCTLDADGERIGNQRIVVADQK